MHSSSIIAKISKMESLYIMLSYNIMSTEHALLVTVDVYNRHAVPFAYTMASRNRTKEY
jgi:hypothetical protein